MGLFLALAACGGLDREAQREVEERVGSVLRERYVFPELGARLDSSLREAEARGDFVSATPPGVFADALSQHIRELSSDGHLWVEFNPGPYPEPDPEPGAEGREDDERRRGSIYSLRDLAGSRLAQQPVFVLTERSTFSAGEGLAYLLKHLNRATVVGEQTGGGAHRGRFHRVSAEFLVVVAKARVTSPVTGENWEGRGVRPDVEVPAEQALEVAQRLAIESLARRE